MLLFTRVLSDCTCVLLAFTRVFKWYRLKPMQFQACYVIRMLKPMHTAIKEWREAGEERRRGGKEERRRGGEEERRREGEKEGRLAAIHTGCKGYHKCVVAVYTGF